jgi:hypothetical protein
MKNTKFRNLCLFSEDHCWLLHVKVMKCIHNETWKLLTFRPMEHFWKKCIQNNTFHFSLHLCSKHFCSNTYLTKYDWYNTEIHTDHHVTCSSFLTNGMGQQIWVKLFLKVKCHENLFVSFQVALCMQMDREQF